MVSHTYSKEANIRAKSKFYENHNEMIKFDSKFKYKYNDEYREQKKQKMIEYNYKYNAITFIKYLFK